MEHCAPVKMASIKSTAVTKIDWNIDLVGALIEQVHENETVWNTASRLYKNKNSQEAAWLRISSNIGLEGRPSCARAKWRDLRDTFRKKLKVMSPKPGDAGRKKKRTWPWMKTTEFTKTFFNIEVSAHWFKLSGWAWPWCGWPTNRLYNFYLSAWISECTQHRYGRWVEWLSVSSTRREYNFGRQQQRKQEEQRWKQPKQLNKKLSAN